MSIIQAVVATVAAALGTNWLWTAYRSRKDQPRWRTGVVLEGEIVGFLTRFQGARTRNPAVSPVVSYKTPEGEVKELESLVGRNPNPYVLGQKVAVRYVAGRQPPAELDSVAESSESVTPLVAFGILFWGVALLIAFFDRVTGFLEGFE